MLTDNSFMLGTLLVDRSRNKISSNGHTVHVEPRLMKVLVRLASEPGQTVERPDLLDAGWDEAPYVSDESLTKAISELRRLLERCDPDATYIETIPKKGYRLIAPVEPAQADRTEELPSATARKDGDRMPERIGKLQQTVRRMKMAVAATCVLVVAASGAWMLSSPEPQVRIRRVAVPAHGLSLDASLARVVSDTTFALDGEERQSLRDFLGDRYEWGSRRAIHITPPADTADSPLTR